LVVDDGNADDTAQLVRNLCMREPDVRLVCHEGWHGFGMPVRAGIDSIRAVAIFMADAPDDPEDLVRYYDKLEEGYECFFWLSVHSRKSSRRLPTP
jgi:dolichol-phosphate mannosyltransferase